MLVIRLARVGKKHQPSYRIAVAERRSKLGGPPREYIGSYNPFTKKVSVDPDRIAHWLKMGAQVSDTVWNFLVRDGIVTGAKRSVKIKAKKEMESAATAPVKKEEKTTA